MNPAQFTTSLVVALALGTPVRAYQWLEPGCETLLEVDTATLQDAFGWRVLDLGDVDFDGIPDLVTSAPLSAQGASAGGKVEAYSGADGSLIWGRAETLTSAIMGYDMATLHWDADGVLDVLASAPFNGASGGRVWVLSGVDGSTLHRFDSVAGSGENFGSSLAVNGDYDGDGVDDVAVGAAGFDQVSGDNAGRVYVFSGSNALLLDTIEAPLQVAGDEEFGIGLTFLTDISNPSDGRDELVAVHRDTSFWSGGAIAYEYDGANSTALWSIRGVGQDYSLFGNRIDGGLDVNDDGHGDLLVSASGLDQAQVFSGLDGALIHLLDGNGEGEQFGAGHLVPDATGDGRADLLLSSRSYDGGAADAGRIWLYSGNSGEVVRTMTYAVREHRLGMDVRQVGDRNGDTLPDIAVAGTGGGTSGPPPGRFLVVGGRLPYEPYCDATVNSTGLSAGLEAFGTSSVGRADLVLTADSVPNQSGIFLHGAAPIRAPFGNGFLCTSGQIRRGNVVVAAGHVASYAYDATSPKRDLSAHVGSTRNFQFWYRDPMAGGAVFNTSNALAVPILP